MTIKPDYELITCRNCQRTGPAALKLHLHLDGWELPIALLIAAVLAGIAFLA